MVVAITKRIRGHSTKMIKRNGVIIEIHDDNLIKIIRMPSRA